MQELTERQNDICRFIIEYKNKYGYSPTQEEIAEGISISRSTLREHIDRMIKKGRITKTGNVARSIIAN